MVVSRNSVAYFTRPSACVKTTTSYDFCSRLSQQFYHTSLKCYYAILDGVWPLHHHSYNSPSMASLSLLGRETRAERNSGGSELLGEILSDRDTNGANAESPIFKTAGAAAGWRQVWNISHDARRMERRGLCSACRARALLYTNYTIPQRCTAYQGELHRPDCIYTMGTRFGEFGLARSRRTYE